MKNNSRLGLGFMRYDLRKDNQPLVDFALDHGINYFETCYFYLDHQCENFVYNLLNRYSRYDYEICGKLSLNEAFYPEVDYKLMYESQLKKVPKNYFDYYILQTLRPSSIHQVFNIDIYEFFQKEKEKGNIKNFGFSEQCDPTILKPFLQTYQWDIAQMPLNYFDWFLCQSNKNYDLIKQRNIPIIAQAPYKGGLLMKHMPAKTSEIFLQKYNKTKEQVALDFVIDQNPDIILTGCSTLENLKKTYNNFINHSSLCGDYGGIHEALKLYQQENLIPCIMCEKCTFACPQHINIPLFFSAYNKALLNNNNFEEYSLLKYFLPEPIHLCTYCNECIAKCPVNIDIPSHFEQVFELRP